MHPVCIIQSSTIFVNTSEMYFFLYENVLFSILSAFFALFKKANKAPFSIFFYQEKDALFNVDSYLFAVYNPDVFILQ